MSNDKTIIKVQTIVISLLVALCAASLVNAHYLSKKADEAEDKCQPALELVDEASAKLDEARAKYPDAQEDDFELTFTKIAK